ncbi:MAG TPA: hypothetical protein VFY73_20690 [Ideonella sp.]|uniref:pilus assembly PilX family protein n=1 Tax=Ideonella sp. TaxID=1929293 RepID=UPI002E336CB1|nr:hypothetical protein [Ideonella sp.]HEX5686454.1 hypothetical protein [Ideonella sp.]
MSSTRRFHARRHHRRDERGVALMVALVMLVIIGIASVSIMRGALSSDLIANNTRVQSLAMQAAQIAMRYCEDEVVKVRGGGPPTIIIQPAGAHKWDEFANWKDSAIVNTVPDTYMKSDDSTFVPSTMPQCIVDSQTFGSTEVFQITARGFSPDYSADGDGNTESGSVVWLQSMLRL